jgi:hypothetical protein
MYGCVQGAVPLSQLNAACRISGGFVPFPEQDKENDIRNAQATQAVIQRRKRPKRRSTGVVHIDMDVRILLLELNFRKQDIYAYILSLDEGCSYPCNLLTIWPSGAEAFK